MKVLFVSAEVTPLAKVGGLGDVIGALPKELIKLGVEPTILLPYYKLFDKVKPKKINLTLETVNFGGSDSVELFETYLPDTKIRVLLAKHPILYREEVYGYPDDSDRFAYFSVAVLKLLKTIKFDLVHCHDWHTGLIPLGLAGTIPSLFTIHNVHPDEGVGFLRRDVIKRLGLPVDKLATTKDVDSDSVNLLAQGIVYADRVNTVSPTHAKEIQTTKFGGALAPLLKSRSQNLTGILNGIDTEIFNPATDRSIVQQYDVKTLDKKIINKRDLEKVCDWSESDHPILGMVTRLTEQKGVDIVVAAAPELVKRHARIVILGTGDPNIENMLRQVEKRYPDNLKVFIKFDAILAQKIYAGSDFFLMPSRFEPCGLGQMIAMRYGTVPIVHPVGGLKDSVIDNKTGFWFTSFSRNKFLVSVSSAINLYHHSHRYNLMQQQCASQDFSWGSSANKYLDLYKLLLSK